MDFEALTIDIITQVEAAVLYPGMRPTVLRIRLRYLMGLPD